VKNQNHAEFRSDFLKIFYMKKITKVLMIAIIICMAKESTAQNNFFSNLYFPSEFGMNFPINSKPLQSGVLITSGIEYRFKVDKGSFIRFNYDNLSNPYEIEANSMTNVLKSRLKSDLVLIGMGYRFGKTKFKYHGLLQLGLNQSQFPVVHGIGQGTYHVTFTSVHCFAVKAGAGVEYDLTNEFVITLEPQLLYMPAESIFWDEDYFNFGLKIGFSALLF